MTATLLTCAALCLMCAAALHTRKTTTPEDRCQPDNKITAEETWLRMIRNLEKTEGQDIAEYAVMLAVILVLVVGTVSIIGANANNVFSSVASSVQ
jgi:Flp pilus assembly pilin Flp